MQADYEVDLGPDAPALEVPWRSADGSARYFDLRSRPELLLEIREAAANPELARFLSAINAPRSHFQSARSTKSPRFSQNDEGPRVGGPSDRVGGG